MCCRAALGRRCPRRHECCTWIDSQVRLQLAHEIRGAGYIGRDVSEENSKTHLEQILARCRVGRQHVAALGAIGGAIAGNAGKGAAIGALAGSLFGGARRSSRKSEEARWREHQRQQQYEQQQAYEQQVAQAGNGYRNAYALCMSSRNYTVQ